MRRHPGCLTATGLFVLVVIGALVWASRDLPAVDDHGLGEEPVPIRADRNAYPLLLDATNALVTPPDWVAVWAKDGTNWDEAGVEALLSAQAELFERLDVALSREEYRSPTIRSFDNPLPGMACFRVMGRLLKVKSEWHLRRGEKPEATDACIKLVRLGHLIQSGSGSLIEYLVGIAIKSMGLDQTLAVGLSLENSRSLLVLNQLLEGYLDSAAGLDAAMTCEYRMAAGILDQLSSGDVTGMGLLVAAQTGPSQPQTPGSWMPNWMKRGLVRPFLHPNRTKQRFADYYEELIMRREFPLNKASGPLLQAFRVEVEALEKDGTMRLVRRNPVGVILTGLMLPALEKMREKTANLECKTSGVRQVLALRAYYLEKGKWPEKLTELAPDYLAALPRDPYDGAPAFRYDPVRRRIYAVGPDFMDDGGADGKDIGWELVD